MKKRDKFSFGPKTTGYSGFGYYHIGEDDLKETSLYSLEIFCSQMDSQMSNADIKNYHDKTGDYDANEMYFNIWVNGFLIQFHFELMGLHVEYDALELHRQGHVHMATTSIVSRAIDAVVVWLQNHCIEEISETFYEVAEQGIAWQIVEEFKFRR